MRNKGNPEGRVYDIKPKRQWSRDTSDEVNEADVDINALPSRTVLVIGRSGQRRGWCRVACIVNQRDTVFANGDLYVPSSPTKKNSSTGMQLVFCFGHRFYRRSWLNLDEVVELPRWVLEDVEMELQSKSYSRLEEFMRSRAI